jgi:hypothetical protein
MAMLGARIAMLEVVQINLSPDPDNFHPPGSYGYVCEFQYHDETAPIQRTEGEALRAGIDAIASSVASGPGTEDGAGNRENNRPQQP